MPMWVNSKCGASKKGFASSIPQCVIPKYMAHHHLNLQVWLLFTFILQDFNNVIEYISWKC